MTNNKDVLNDLTIVIPTYNRNFYLSRCLSYHTQFPYAKIIIADSSTQSQKEKNIITIEKIQNKTDVEILYLEYKPETEPLGGDIYKKWADAIYHINSKYSKIITDKEFSIPLGERNCLNYLNEHPSINLCEGKYYYIETLKSGQIIFRNMYPSKISLLNNSPLERIKCAEINANSSSNQMGIRRTEFHKSLYNYLENQKIDDLRFGEITLELLSIIHTKTMYLDTPYCYRDISNYTLGWKLNKKDSSSLRYPNLYRYQKMGIYEDYHQRFISCLLNTLKLTNPEINESDLVTFIETDALNVIKKRSFFRNDIFKQHPLWCLWQYAPDRIKKMSIKIIPKKYIDCHFPKTNEEFKIIDIINSFTKNSDTNITAH